MSIFLKQTDPLAAHRIDSPEAMYRAIRACGIVPFFAYSVVVSMGISWQFGMMAVFVEGIIFLICTLIPVREKIFNAIPLPLKTAIGVGIGFFIAYIGL